MKPQASAPRGPTAESAIVLGEMPGTPDSAADVLIIGGGASGMVAAIRAARLGRRTILVEKSPSLGRKLLASGGQRCNLSNTLDTDQFMERVGREGRFMGPALAELGGPKLREFFHGIGVQTVVLDGFRVWPETRKSATVLAGLMGELERLAVEVVTNCEVQSTVHESTEDGGHFVIRYPLGEFRARQLVIATGGLALPKSGASGGGYAFAESFGHKVTARHPAGVPVVTAEDWPGRCTAHTIGKAHLQVDMKKHAKVARTGDLIFTKSGLRGPVVLDISRELSPLLERYGEVPIVMNLCGGRTQEDWQLLFKEWRTAPVRPVIEWLEEELPLEVAEVICELSDVDPTTLLQKLPGEAKDTLIRTLVKTPLTITGHTGYDGAFVTRGGARLKDVRPETLESKLQPGLYLCGEVLDLDGPCGGFNLQWAFASGYLAGSGLGLAAASEASKKS
ncbi:putative FAD-binding dehydrogenase [Planctomycetes bacterium Poly30]|uniref:Putative FAD-binding dehydrogenase n=1 Tax=Saltatorellus ferox TaxID=2528018 RepID=A0A518EZB6_9BACT|nr:putative FAD-binding dehydrogenase [Planctomycetes bacterium Poly30]